MERETSGWCPFHGPVYLHHSDELQFRTWCTRADNVLELLLVRNVPSDAAQEIPASDIEVHSMSLEDVVNKLWTVKVPLNKQDRVWYMFRIDGKDDERWPDPATRFQPRDVFSWSEFRRPSVCVTPINRSSCWPTAIYELHVGTFTAEGTYLAAIEKLPFLKDLGVDCIEILPVSDWVGRWNWGYDGVCLYSPSRAYGNPDDLRRLVLRAHELGIQVWLDLGMSCALSILSLRAWSMFSIDADVFFYFMSDSPESPGNPRQPVVEAVS
jgi:1,4-alpha-glucan branching enzyme